MRYSHTNIISKDWKKLATFYTEVFECVPVPPERKQSGKWLERGTGLKGADLEGIHLRLPGYGEEGPTLEIHQYKETTTGNPQEVNHPGLRHLAFSVNDVENTMKAIISNGGSSLGEITTKEIPGVGEITFVYTADPEGNIIEIQSWH